jgi:ankyrin repeat protein
VALLLGAGADPKSTNAEGMTVLQCAVKRGKMSIVQLLMNSITEK